MIRFKMYALALTFSLSTLAFSVSVAQPLPEDGPLADGELTEEELVAVIASAQQQLIRLSEEATEEYEATIRDQAPNMPAAWMLMKDGETVKRINIDDGAQNIPPAARIKMYRAAIKAVAQGGQINAGAILYTGRVSEENSTEVLIIEHEHRLGVSANKVIGFEVREGQIFWADPLTQDKPFEWFHDGSGKRS